MPEGVTDRIVTDRLNRIVWNQRQVSQKPDIKSNGKNWLMDTMPFNAVLKEKLTDDRPLQYLCEGKYISFKPVGGISVKGLLKADKRSVTYKDGLGAGISLEVEVSQDHWKKLIKIDSLNAIDTSQKFIEFKFLVETDFDIPERENKKPRIKLGENSFIEVSQAWDNSSENKIPVRSFFKKIGGKLYFIKQIPTGWLKTAQFPVWTDVDIVYGSAQVFEPQQTYWCQCCEIDTNKFVVAYRNRDDGDAGKARVGTVSGTTITWGAINEFYADVSLGNQLGVCKLDTDKFVVVYMGSGNDGYARVGTVATRTISWGAEKEFETGNTTYLSCTQLGIDKFAIVYKDFNVGTICIATVSGTTITSGTPVAFEGETKYNRCCKLDTDKLVAVYEDDADGDKCKACAFTVVGLVPTPGAIKEIDANSTSEQDCAQLDTDKFVIAWRDETGVHGAIEICTVSGTTITEGAEVEFNPDQSWYMGLAKIDATHFVVVYRDLGNANKGTSRYCSFSGTTITLGDEEIFHDASTIFSDVCLISANKIAVVYRDEAGSPWLGEAIIGDTPVAGVDYPISTSPGLNASATVLKGWGRTKTTSPGVTASVSIDRDMAWGRGVSPGLTLAVSLLKGWGRTIATSVGLTVSTALLVSKGWTVTTATGLTAAATIVRTFGRVITTSPGLTVAVSVTRFLGRAITTNTALSVAVSITKSFARSVATSAGLTVSVSLLKGWGRSIATSSSLAISTAILVSKGWKITTATALAVSTTIARTVAWGRSVSSGLTAAVAVSITTPFRHVITLATGLTVSATVVIAWFRNRKLTVKVITSQYRNLVVVTTQYRAVRIITSMYRKIKSITSGG